MEQLAFADLEYRGKRRRTRRGPFLEGQGPVQSGGTDPELQLRRRQLQKQGDSARGGAALHCWGGSASRKEARKRVVVASDDHFYNGCRP